MKAGKIIVIVITLVFIFTAFSPGIGLQIKNNKEDTFSLSDPANKSLGLSTETIRGSDSVYDARDYDTSSDPDYIDISVDQDEEMITLHRAEILDDKMEDNGKDSIGNRDTSVSERTLVNSISNVDRDGLAFTPTFSDPDVYPLNYDTFADTSVIVLVNSQSPNYSDFEQYIQPYLDYFDLPYSTLNIFTAPVTESINNHSLIIIGHSNLDTDNVLLNSTEETLIKNSVLDGIGLVNFDGNLSAGGTPIYEYPQQLFGFSYGLDYSASSPIEIVTSDHYITNLQTTGNEYSLSGSIRGVNITNTFSNVTTLINVGSYPLVLESVYGEGKAVQFTSYQFLDWNIFGYFGGLDDIFWRSFVWSARKPFVMEGMPHFVSIRVDDAYGGDTLIEQLSPTGNKGPSGKTEPWSYVKVFNKYGFKPHVAFFLDDISLSWNDTNPYNVSNQIPSSEKWYVMEQLVDNRSMDVSIHAKFGINGGYKDTFFYYDLPNGTEFDDVTLAEHFAQADANFTYYNVTKSKVVLPHFYYIGSKSIPYLEGWGTEFTGNRIKVDLSTFYSAPYNKYQASNKEVLKIDWGYDNGTYKIFNMIAEPLDITYDWLPSVCSFGSPANIAKGISIATDVFKREFDSMAPAYLMVHEEYINSCTDSDLDSIMAGIVENIMPYNPEFVNFDYLSQYCRAKFLSNLSAASYDPSTRILSVDFVGQADIPIKFYLFTEKISGDIKSQLIEVSAYNDSTTVTYEFPPAPQWRNQGQNVSSIHKNEPIKLYAEVKGKGLQYATLATNETGSWQTWGSTGSWFQTTQIDFDGGTKENVDTSISPGDVRLQLPSTTDYASYTQGTTASATSVCRGGGCSAGQYPPSAIIDDVNANNPTNCWVSDYDSPDNWDEYVNVTLYFTSNRTIERIVIYNRPTEYFETVYYTFSDASRYPESGTLDINAPSTFEHIFSARTVNQIVLHLYGLNLAGNAGICELAIYGPGNYTGNISGNFTSMAFDTTASSHYLNLSWSATTPGNSSIKFQIATSNNGSTGDFLGPDGTPNTYYETSRTIINSSHNGNRYIKYKAYFHTDNSSSIPVLHNVRIDYLAQKYTSPIYLNNATDTWVLTEFVWQNPSLDNQSVAWKIYYTDVYENWNITNEMVFSILPDTTPPTIVSINPSNNSINVSLKTYPTIVFTESIDPSTLTGSVNGKPFVSTQLAFDDLNQTLVIDLGEMEYEKTYSIVINGSLQDTSGNPLGDNYAFSFNTTKRVSKLPTSTIEVPSDLEPGETYTITGKATGYIWQKEPDNPLELRHWDQYGVDTGDRPMLHPTALYFPDGENGYKFYLAYTPYPPASNENPCLMRSNDGKTFTAAGVTNPLFKYNTQPIYDSQNLADPEFIKVGNTWMIFYEMEQSNYGHIGVTFSTNGVNYMPYGGSYDPPRPTFPFPTDGNPVIVFSNDTWYEVDEDPNDSYPRLGEAAAVFKDSMYHVWYGSYNTNGTWAVYANSSDPRGPWTKYGPVLDNGRHPDVVYDPERDLYVMWYLCGQNCIATAPSPVGPWTNHPNNPIFSAEGGWEGSSLYRSTLLQVDGQWYLYYSANPGSNGMIGLAKEISGVRKAEISTNGGSSWTQLMVNPDGTWSYQWSPPLEGIYYIQVRVTDDWLVGAANETIVHVGAENLSECENPILILVNYSIGSFGKYTGEILKAEGISEFQIENISLVNESYLYNFDVVILTSIPINSTQITMVQNYVSSGGKLIVFKPDTQLALLLGITPVGTNTSEGYILVDNTTDIGKGIVGETIQFHTSADHYSLNGASEIARLYSDATTTTIYPAITINNNGSGEVVTFTYDFPKSIAYQRQGNPLWAGQDRDGIATVRANDMFYSNEPEVPHWINPDKAMIPQADEQDKILANAINFLNRNTKPLPRLWYFPALNKSVLVNRDGDTDNSRTGIYELLDGIEVYGGRTTLYLMPYNIISAAESASFKARGHGVALHVNAGCGAPKTYEQMNAAFTAQTNNFIAYHGFHPRTEVNHCGEWVGWVQQAHIEENLGYEMDFNYFPWAPTAGGYMTGASQPIKFVDINGTIINVFQQSYQSEDNLINWGFRTCATLTDLTIQLIDDAIEKYHTPVVMHIHPVYYVPTNCKMQWANDSWAHANSKGVPILSSDMWLDFTDMRYNTQIRNITWNNYQLSFIMDIPSGDYEITVMVPLSFKGAQFYNVTKDGIIITHTTKTIDEREYALITTSASTHTFTATYQPPESIPPTWRNQGQSSSTLVQGDFIMLYAQGKDETSLSQAILSTNETGSWENKTIYGSPMDMGGTTDWTWSNFSWQNPSIGGGTVVGWRIYYVDSSGNSNVTDVMTFTVTNDTILPIWRNQGQNASNILPGKSILLYAEGKDNVALDWAWLSTNQTGEWKNYSVLYELNTFNDSTSSKSILFNSAGSKVDAWIKILKNAQVTEGSINVSGLSIEQINLDQQNIYTAVAANNVVNSQWVGQSFIAEISGQLSAVSIYLHKEGNPSTNAYVRIYNCSGGLPSGSPIASQTVTPAELGTANNVWFNVTFNLPPTITAGNTYCYIVESSANPSNPFKLGVSGTNTAYLNGTTVYTNDQGGSWNNAGYDEPFKIYVSTEGSYPTSPTLNIGNTTPDDWSFIGSLNNSNSPQQVSLNITKLNNILSICSCSGCSVLDDYCVIPINISSQSSGIIMLDALNIKYDAPLKMQENNQWQWANFTWSNSSISAGPIAWKIYFTDTVGNENATNTMTFTINPDTTSPVWQNQGQSSSTPNWGEPVTLFAQSKDETGLSYAVLSTNETGTWENKTTYGSPMDLGNVSDVWVWSNFSWLNTSLPVNSTVGWKIYYVDSSGNSVVTDVMTFTLKSPEIVNISVPPILVLTNNLSSNKFGRYVGEILKTEGINEFQIEEIYNANFSIISNFDFMLLTEMPLTSSQVSILENYVLNGGNLIAFRPDTQLATVCGLTPLYSTTSEGYVEIDNSTDIGKGITNETMQFHGTADNYNLNGATEIARLYSNATTPTTYPAVTINNYGRGYAVAFTYDLAQSTLLLRQGNPANAGLRNRPMGLFENYLDTNKVPIPQADEQMRVLSNAIFNLINNSKPLPRLWYFPDFEKTILVMNLYEYGPATGGAPAIYQAIADVEARGGTTSLYLTESHNSSNALNWTSRGHELSKMFLYPNSCPITGNYNTFNTSYITDINTFQLNYGFKPKTAKHNCIAWFDYVDVGDIQQLHDVRIDGNYIPYFDNIAWFTSNGYKNGWITGSGLPMKFVNTNGEIYDSYQFAVEFGDESQTEPTQGGMTGDAAALAAATLFNKSRDGFYSAFGTNFYVSRTGEGKIFELKLMDYAQSYSIPILSSLQLLNFVDAKNNATFENITYSENQLSFILNIPNEINNLTVMVPHEYNGGGVGSITLNSSAQSFSNETIKGIEYAWFVVNSVGNYEVNVSYIPDTVPPIITIDYPVNGTTLPAGTISTPVNITTDESAYCRYSTNPTFSYSEGINFTYGQGTTEHSFIYSGLADNTTYDLYYLCEDLFGNINDVSTHHRFSVGFGDTIPPMWRNQGQNSSIITPGGSILLYAQGKDETALSQAILSTNETGTWVSFTDGYWFYPSWDLRKKITINNTQNVNPLSEYQISLNLTYDPDMQSDFSDIRFTWYNSTLQTEIEIPYWIEQKVDGSWAYVWIKVPEIPASDYAIVYVYYKNPGASSVSNVTATFVRVIDGTEPVKLALPFDENSGTTAFDKSGNGNDGTLVNSPSWVNGKFGKALQFNGVNNYVSVANSASLNPSTMTIEAWANATSPGTNKYIASKSDGGGTTGFGFYTGSTGRIFLFVGVGGTAYLTPDVPSFSWDGTWKHVVGVYDGSNVKIYVNGQFKGQTAVSGTIGTNAFDLTIGEFTGGGSFYFNGIIDEVRMYDRGLNNTEISDLYNNYGYVTINYPGRVFIRKYASITPAVTMGSEQTKGTRPIDMNNATNWTWSNFTWSNPGITNGSIAWRIYYVDTSNNSNATDVMMFNIADLPPTWRNQGQNTSTPTVGAAVKLFAEGNDDTGLSAAVLATNETGAWLNWTNIMGNWTQTTQADFDAGEKTNLSIDNPGSIKFNTSYIVDDDFEDGTLEGLTLIVNTDSSTLENVVYQGSRRAKITDMDTDSSQWKVWEKTYTAAPSSDYIVEIDVSVQLHNAFSLTDLIVFARDSSTGHCVILRQNPNDVDFNVDVYDGAYHFIGTVSMDKGTGNFHTFKAYFAYDNKTVFIYRDDSIIGSYIFATNVIADNYRLASSYQGTTTYYIDNYRVYSSNQSLSGTFVSSAYDTGSSLDYQTITWSSSEPAGTSIMFQIATNNDNSTWNFLGPDGTLNTFYEISGAAINSTHDGERYIKYKAFFSRLDYSTTPILDEVSIAFKPVNYAEYGSPMNMGNVADWTWSNFTWQNPDITEGTFVGWKIYYIDINGQSNVTDVMTFRIVGPYTPPEITNVIDFPDIQETGGYVNITCDVTDDVAVDIVKVNITYPDTTTNNFSMDPGSYYFNQTYSMVGTYDYFIWANDTNGNSNKSSIYSFIIQDTTPPEITDILVTMSDPIDTDPLYGWTNITCRVTDNMEVNQVFVNITYPDLLTNSLLMIDGGGGQYYYNTTYTAVGNYSYFIWADDISNNDITSSVDTFQIPPNWDIFIDGKCSVLDLVYVSNHYDEIGPYNGWIREDVNNDGIIKVLDLVLVANHYDETWP